MLSDAARGCILQSRSASGSEDRDRRQPGTGLSSGKPKLSRAATASRITDDSDLSPPGAGSASASPSPPSSNTPTQARRGPGTLQLLSNSSGGHSVRNNSGKSIGSTIRSRRRNSKVSPFVGIKCDAADSNSDGDALDHADSEFLAATASHGGRGGGGAPRLPPAVRSKWNGRDNFGSLSIGSARRLDSVGSTRRRSSSAGSTADGGVAALAGTPGLLPFLRTRSASVRYEVPGVFDQPEPVRNGPGSAVSSSQTKSSSAVFHKAVEADAHRTESSLVLLRRLLLVLSLSIIAITGVIYLLDSNTLSYSVVAESIQRSEGDTAALVTVSDSD